MKRYGEAPPFEEVQKFNEKEDVRRPRRAATAEEIEKIMLELRRLTFEGLCF